MEVAANRFIFRRGALRGAAHWAIMWGCLLAAAITFPLVWGWVHFETVPGALTNDPPSLAALPSGDAWLGFRGQNGKLYVAKFSGGAFGAATDALTPAPAITSAPGLAAGRVGVVRRGWGVRRGALVAVEREAEPRHAHARTGGVAHQSADCKHAGH